MPCPRVEGTVKVLDQVMLCEVEFDLTEQLRERDRPHVQCGR